MITINGVAYAMQAPFAESFERVGEQTRNFDGGLASQVRTEKRRWTGATSFLSASELGVLRTATALDAIVAQLDRCFTNLNAQIGKTGQALTENEWLMSIRSRSGIPGGTCGFDLPSYYAWQHRPATERQQALEGWASTLAPLAESIYLLLKLLRDAGVPQKVVAERGQLQQNLPQGRTFQLLRLRIDPALQLVPEISGNRLMVSVRLMHQLPDGPLQASTDDAVFELTLCA